MQIRNSFNAWQSFQTKKGAKPRHKTGGAKRRDWSHNKSFTSVCFVQTRDDVTPHLGAWPQPRPKREDQPLPLL